MYDKGHKFYLAKDFKNALPYFIEPAARNYAPAQHALGLLYEKGERGVPKDEQESFRWYTKAANAGYTSSRYNLARLYFYGSGTAKDYQLALFWCEMATTIVNIVGKTVLQNAQRLMGDIYDIGGHGVEKNDVNAIEWYTKAIENGNTYSHHVIGAIYYYGSDGVDKDYKKAYHHFQQAGDILDKRADAQNYLGIMHQNGYGIEEDYKKALEWYKKSALQENKYAQYNIGNLYYEARGLEKDYKKAFDFKSCRARIPSCSLPSRIPI